MQFKSKTDYLLDHIYVTVHFVIRVSEKLKNLKLRSNNYMTIHVVTRVNVTETSETEV